MSFQIFRIDPFWRNQLGNRNYSLIITNYEVSTYTKESDYTYKYLVQSCLCIFFSIFLALTVLRLNIFQAYLQSICYAQ